MSHILRHKKKKSYDTANNTFFIVTIFNLIILAGNLRYQFLLKMIRRVTHNLFDELSFY